MCKRSNALSWPILIGRGLQSNTIEPSNLIIFQQISNGYAVVNVQSGNRWPSTITGVYGDEVPPVLIPNTEVKLISADGTWLDTAWESMSMPVSKKHSVNTECFFFSLKYFWLHTIWCFDCYSMTIVNKFQWHFDGLCPIYLTIEDLLDCYLCTTSAWRVRAIWRFRLCCVCRFLYA